MAFHAILSNFHFLSTTVNPDPKRGNDFVAFRAQNQFHVLEEELSPPNQRKASAQVAKRTQQLQDGVRLLYIVLVSQMFRPQI